MHVATNIFQKLNWAFFEILIFFNILGGSKSKFCEFLHFWTLFIELLLAKEPKYKKTNSIQLFKHIISYMYANVQLFNLSFKGEYRFFSENCIKKIAILLQISTKIDIFKGSQNPEKSNFQKFLCSIFSITSASLFKSKIGIFWPLDS